jgi:hypothetical protein
MHYGISSPNFGDEAHARVQAELAHGAAQAGRDGVFLWGPLLLWRASGLPPWYGIDSDRKM